MSAPAERLHDHLTAVHEVDVDEQIALRDALADGIEVTKPRFIVDDDDKANWALRKLAKSAAAMAAVEQAAGVELVRIQEWHDAEMTKIEREASFFEGLLTDYHRQRFAEDPKAKSVKLPAGTLKSRQNPDKWEFDEDEFIEWASAQERFIRTKVEIDRATAKKALQAREGKVLDPETGEIVPGVQVTPGERTFSVEVSE